MPGAIKYPIRVRYFDETEWMSVPDRTKRHRTRRVTMGRQSPRAQEPAATNTWCHSCLAFRAFHLLRPDFPACFPMTRLREASSPATLVSRTCPSPSLDAYVSNPSRLCFCPSILLRVLLCLRETLLLRAHTTKSHRFFVFGVLGFFWVFKFWGGLLFF